MLGHLKRQRKAEENNKDTGRETDIKSVETDRLKEEALCACKEYSARF